MRTGWDLYSSRISVLTPCTISGIVKHFTVEVRRIHKMANREISLRL